MMREWVFCAISTHSTQHQPYARAAPELVADRVLAKRRHPPLQHLGGHARKRDRHGHVDDAAGEPDHTRRGVGQRLPPVLPRVREREARSCGLLWVRPQRLASLQGLLGDGEERCQGRVLPWIVLVHGFGRSVLCCVGAWREASIGGGGRAVI